MLNLIFDFVGGFLLGRTVRNTARIAETASWTEEMKQAHWAEQNEREAHRQAVIEQQRPLKLILFAVIGLIVLLSCAFHG